MNSSGILTDSRLLIMQDFALGFGGLLGPPGFLLLPISVPYGGTTAQLLSILTVSTGCVVGWQYLSERNAFPERAYEVLEHLRAHPLQFVLFTITAIVVVVGPLYVTPSATQVYYPVFLGLFVGLMIYRFLYGIVWPIPEPALNRR